MKLFVFAGEMSADICANRVVSELAPSELIGVGGPHLLKHGQKQILTLHDFQTMGLSDVLKRLPIILKNFRKVKNCILSEKPDLVLFIDQPALTIRLAKSLRKNGYRGKIVQLVAPTVWAYNPKRADEMAKYFDLLLTLFDFEPKYFAHTSLKTVFVGHPIIEELPSAQNSSPTVFSIFPGSRPDEVRRNLPKQLEIAALVKKEIPDLEILVSGRDVSFIKRYELMQKSRIALAKSGTVTLELALLNVPTVVTYELTYLNKLMAKRLQLDKMTHYSIANIVAGKEIFPEFIRPPIQPESVAIELVRLYHEPRPNYGLRDRLYCDIAPSKRIAQEIQRLVR